ncbi:MAG TPA: hypothetical protein VG651_02280 [Stellaceae bacterium]|nr:hypothetical protein [Stellaceae bacterium]
MKPAIAAILTLGVIVGGCAPDPGYVYPAPAPSLTEQGLLDECTVIRREIARQQRIAELSGVMASPLADVATQLNVSNVITGLRQRAVVAGCPV